MAKITIEIPDYKKSSGPDGSEIYEIRGTLENGYSPADNENAFTITKYASGNISFSSNADTEGWFYIYKDQLKIIKKLGLFK
jgi:hypothetical protein